MAKEITTARERRINAINSQRTGGRQTRWWDDADEIERRLNDPLIRSTMPHLIPQMAARADELRRKI